VFQDACVLPATVKQIGYVSDQELRALYESAGCFVFPSFYEGFGLPPLEAMCCGCPVVASRAASLPEICGEAAIYFDPKSPEDIAEKIDKVMSNARLRAEMGNDGKRRATAFSWESCARVIWDIASAYC
jgi:glycosyltransferase involved in cell wall biosynthesis